MVVDLDENVGQGKLPLMTVLFVVANVLIHFVAEWKGSTLDADYMIQVGAMYGPAFWEEHEYYRIVTHFFLHFGFEHLGNNMLSLLVLGYALESTMGRGCFSVLYLLSGVFSGSVSAIHSYVTADWQNSVSCGASGAIYGLMGALLVLLVAKGRKKSSSEVPRFLLYIGLSLYSGMRDPGIDNAAHAGGFVGGVLICIFMCVVKRAIIHRKGQVVS